MFYPVCCVLSVCSVLSVRCCLCVVHCVVCCLLCVLCVLCVLCCWLSVLCCVLCLLRCVLCVMCCASCVVCSLCVARCLLYVVCCVWASAVCGDESNTSDSIGVFRLKSQTGIVSSPFIISAGEKSTRAIQNTYKFLSRRNNNSVFTVCCMLCVISGILGVVCSQLGVYVLCVVC